MTETGSGTACRQTPVPEVPEAVRGPPGTEGMRASTFPRSLSLNPEDEDHVNYFSRWASAAST